MSENETQAVETTPEAGAGNTVQLQGLYAFKVGMSAVYNENGEQVPVTVLQYKPWYVSQVKTKENDGYEAVQLACDPKRANRTSSAQKGHLKNTSFEHGAKFVQEIRQSLPEGVKIGQKVDLASLTKGDIVKLTGTSKGHGFAGVVKRWDFGGGRASHGGSAKLRAPGSVGNRNKPGRVMKNKKMAGHFGDETVTLKSVQIVDVLVDENVVLVKGPVPGARNSLVKLMKA
jgi:large subunit ribosomal protein L3